MGVILEIIINKQKGISYTSYDTVKGYVLAIHRIAEDKLGYVHDAKVLTTDMDGVLIHDDNAIMAARTISGLKAQEMFGAYADKNIRAVSEGQTSYCWYAPTLFVGQLLNGLSTEINRIVGRNMRLIPDTKRYIGILKDLGYDITAVTAGHQEAAEEVSARIGIEDTIGTMLGSSDGVYDGTVARFIGGNYKLKAVEPILRDNGSFKGTHIGDSWSDVQTLEGVPNSIAFNPGCRLALENATISLITLSKMALIPFFDYLGKYDDHLSEENLPHTIVINEATLPEHDIDLLLSSSKEFKKKKLEQILSGEITSDDVQDLIIKELTERGINFQSGLSQFMDPDEFDEFARKAYLLLEN